MGFRVNSTRGTTGRLAEGWERDQMYDRVRSMLDRGMSDADVARQTGLSSRSICRYRAAHGIKNVYHRSAA